MSFDARRLALFIILVLCLSMTGCGFITKLKARDMLNKDVKAFTKQQYPHAAEGRDWVVKAVGGEARECRNDRSSAEVKILIDHNAEGVVRRTRIHDNKLASKSKVREG